MTSNEKLVEKFYVAFQNKDYAGMAACYHDEVRFSDPVFTDLYGNQVKAMWHMLVERGQDLQVTFHNIATTAENGRAHWEANYTFHTGRQVHNIIDATFMFRDALIVEHRDLFDLWRWTRMSLGLTGLLLGWTPIVQNRVRKTAMSSLDKFIANHPEYQ